MEIKKSWSKMTKIEKKEAICKDVLLNIKMKLIVPNHTGYLKFNGTNKSSEQLNKVISPENSCNVCAKGALFVCHIIKRNHFTVKEAHEIDDLSIKCQSNKIAKRLTGIFSINELNLIEASFEGIIVNDKDNYLRGLWGKTSIVLKAINFGRRYKTPKARLIAIMNNIIKNKEFKP